MSLITLPLFTLRNPNPNPNPNPQFSIPKPNYIRSQSPLNASSTTNISQQPTRLVTFLGKGGSGKTTAAILAAKYYANEGLRTCLVVQSQDPTAEQLLNCKIGCSTTCCDKDLYAVRVETSKMLLEPLNRIKKVDSRLNLSQGVLEGVVGGELGVLPGMDSIFSALTLGSLVKFLPGERNEGKPEFDVVVYDGSSTEETLRLIGATERARGYLKYARDMAEKTDIGRLAAPSLLKLAYESARPNSGSGNGKTSIEIWNDIESLLEKTSASFTDSSKFGCYLVMDPSRKASVSTALRYWGCAIQAGTEISGALMLAPTSSFETKEVVEKISPLPFAHVPYIQSDSSVNWDAFISSLGKDVKELLTVRKSAESSVRFDPREKTVTLFMPGFNKTEIKLYQYRGGTELLVEAGDQRRIIRLPSAMQGKVGGAKFLGRNLIVTLR